MEKPAGPGWFWFLKSRKVQTAIATLIVAGGTSFGVFHFSSSDQADKVVEAIVGAIPTVLAGIALILGIAVEDAGQKSSGK